MAYYRLALVTLPGCNRYNISVSTRRVAERRTQRVTKRKDYYAVQQANRNTTAQEIERA